MAAFWKALLGDKIPSSVSCSVAFLRASLSAISSTSVVSGAKACVWSWTVTPSKISSRSSGEASLSLPRTASRVKTRDSRAAMYSRETGGRLKSSSRNSHRTFAAVQLEQGCVLVHLICKGEWFSRKLWNSDVSVDRGDIQLPVTRTFRFWHRLHLVQISHLACRNAGNSVESGLTICVERESRRWSPSESFPVQTLTFSGGTVGEPARRVN